MAERHLAKVEVAGSTPVSRSTGAHAVRWDSLGYAPGNRLYFTAGPNHEADGLFGYLMP